MKIRKTYRWKKAGGQFKALDAGAVGKELEELRAENGEITPAQIVDAARERSSEMHDAFPWDDSVAAQIGRESIARQMIGSLVISIQTPDRKQIDTRAFVSMPDGKQARYYETVEVALDSEEGRAYIVRRAWLELLSVRRRYAALTELAKVWDMVDRENAGRKTGT